MLAEVEALKSQRNRVSKEIGALMGQKRFDEAETKKTATREMGNLIAGYDEIVAKNEAGRDD